MRAVLQRVQNAEVSVDQLQTGAIGEGLLVYLGISITDTDGIAMKMAAKISSLRIFDDSEGKLNQSLQDTKGSILAIPNFTLIADARKGRRPSYAESAPFERARDIFHSFIDALGEEISIVETGVFGADMTINSVARGPVNIILEM